MPSTARCTVLGGVLSRASGNRSSRRARVADSRPSGSCTPATPRPLHAMPQLPIGVSNSAKPYSVMLRSYRIRPRARHTWRILRFQPGRRSSSRLAVDGPLQGGGRVCIVGAAAPAELLGDPRAYVCGAVLAEL